MKRSTLIAIFLCVGIAALGSLAFIFFRDPSVAVLNPHGIIALKERTLMLHAVLFMLIVIVPVYGLLFFFAHRYRAGNTKAVYMPEWEHSNMDELVWWAIPFEIVLVLAALTWSSTHDLDPHKALLSTVAPLEIQVVALEWKWLFIYPEEHIATVNYVEFPVNRPVEFVITADAPMNSFWIPELGGQIYAMTGMTTSLNLMADTPGDFRGGSANYSGEGFAQMHFVARATLDADFNTWVLKTEHSPQTLTESTYQILREPDTTSTQSFILGDQSLYTTIVSKFMSQH